MESLSPMRGTPFGVERCRRAAPSEAPGAFEAIGDQSVAKRWFRRQPNHCGGYRVLYLAFGLSGVDHNSAGRIDEDSRPSASETEDWKPRGKRFEDHHSTGVVQTWKHKRRMAPVRGCNFAVGQLRHPVHVRRDAAFFGNLFEPAGIPPLTDDLQSRVGRPAQDFRHGTQNQVQALPIKKASDV